MKQNYLFTILSYDKKELVSIRTSILNRKQIRILGISSSHTDILAHVLITIEVLIEDSEVRFVQLKFNNIIEVCQVRVGLPNDSWYQKVGLYTVKKEDYNSDVYARLQKYGATMLAYYQDQVVIQKIGRDEVIQIVYNELDEPYLTGFSKSAAMSLLPLHWNQSSVISRAA